MCKMCNGTHVVQNDGNYYTTIHCCPNCGPDPERQIWLEAFYERITARKAELDQLNQIKEVC